jgi:hypothetical protein
MVYVTVYDSSPAAPFSAGTVLLKIKLDADSVLPF